MEERIREKLEGKMAKWLKRDNLLILLLAGVLLVVIALPTEKSGGERSDPEPEQESSGDAAGEPDAVFSDVEDYAAYLEKRLEDTLARVSGVGEVQVMITLQATRELVLEKDLQTQSSDTSEADSQGGSRTSRQAERTESTVYHSSGNSEPYVIKTLMPRVEGVVVVAQGAGSGNIDRNITDVVQALFGVEAHKVKVVKMDSGANISE